MPNTGHASAPAGDNGCRRIGTHVEVLECVIGETAVAAIVDATIIPVYKLLLLKGNLLTALNLVHVLYRSPPP